MTITITITVKITVAITITIKVTITITIKTYLHIGNFGANCWGGFAVHLEMNAPPWGYLARMGFSLKAKANSKQNLP